MDSRRSFLKTLPAAALACSSAAHAAVLRPSILEDDRDSLRSLAARRGIAYGSAVSTYQLRDRPFAAALAREAGVLVPEYEMKRGVIEPVRDQANFEGCDAIADFARTHTMSMRGHPL